MTRSSSLTFAGAFAHVVVLLAVALVSIFAASTASAAITVTIDSPQPGAVAGLSLNVSVAVSSTFELIEVHAQVETVGADLDAPASAGEPWTGTVAIGALSRGTKTLTVTATDLLAGTGSTSVSFTHDNPPVITVTNPLDWTVARPNVQVTATCTDDDVANGCTDFKVAVGGQPPLATGASAFDELVSLGAFEGLSPVLTFSASDSAGRLTQVTRIVLVDSSSTLEEVVTVGGRILDGASFFTVRTARSCCATSPQVPRRTSATRSRYLRQSATTFRSLGAG